ncbi:MAG: hypothetical protein FGM50_01120 [Mycobacterium sp.]|nr:hypothetical protein [Mycobacterium sp.]
MMMAGVALPAAWLLAGCGSGADLVSTVALPTEQAAEQTRGFGDGLDVPGGTDSQVPNAPLELTAAQRGYLDALGAAGVRPTNELRALSIGSYICQARAAGQSEQAVWDHVAPMVRSDVADARVSAQTTPGMQADAAVATYIRIAGQRLC